MNNQITSEMLMKKVKNYLPKGEIIDQIENCLKLAEERQKGFKRADGADLISHSIAVAYILAELNVDEKTIISALLHESVTNESITIEEIKELYGDEVALITENVSKINKLKLSDESESSSI